MIIANTGFFLALANPLSNVYQDCWAKIIFMNQVEVITLVQSHQVQLQQLGVKSLDLFGSVARDQATPQSDVDILVELAEPVGFFEFFRIQHYLEDLLQRPIDLGTIDALKEHLRQPVLREVVRVF